MKKGIVEVRGIALAEDVKALVAFIDKVGGEQLKVISRCDNYRSGITGEIRASIAIQFENKEVES